jgi:hypothetical protein
MSNFEKRLDESLERLSALIDKVAKSGDPNDIRKAVTAASQLARIRERVAQARREQEPTDDNCEIPPATTEERLKSLRALLKQYSRQLDV